MASFTGGARLEAALRNIERQVQKSKSVRVGFLENATYPDGESVAQVAAWMNYGTKTAPPRPFFTRMIDEKSPAWGGKLGRVLVANNYDAKKALNLMGAGIKTQLQAAITDLDAPALSPVTLMIRKMLINNPSLQVNATVVGEAARKVADGESSGGASTKVGVYTGHMLNSVDWSVKE